MNGPYLQRLQRYDSVSAAAAAAAADFDDALPAGVNRQMELHDSGRRRAGDFEENFQLTADVFDHRRRSFSSISTEGSVNDDVQRTTHFGDDAIIVASYVTVSSSSSSSCSSSSSSADRKSDDALEKGLFRLIEPEVAVDDRRRQSHAQMKHA